MTKPLDHNKYEAIIADGDCFGLAWSPKEKECSMCADHEVCGIMFEQHVKRQKSEWRKQQAARPMDEQNFANISYEKVLEVVKKNSGTMTGADLVRIIAKNANTDDIESVKWWVKSFIRETGIRAEGKILHYDN